MPVGRPVPKNTSTCMSSVAVAAMRNTAPLASKMLPGLRTSATSLTTRLRPLSVLLEPLLKITMPLAVKAPAPVKLPAFHSNVPFTVNAPAPPNVAL